MQQILFIIQHISMISRLDDFIIQHISVISRLDDLQLAKAEYHLTNPISWSSITR